MGILSLIFWFWFVPFLAAVLICRYWNRHVPHNNKPIPVIATIIPVWNIIGTGFAVLDICILWVSEDKFGVGKLYDRINYWFQH